MKIVPFILLPFVLIGCASAPSPQAQAVSRCKPFIIALQAYHDNFGDYPGQLDELRPRYLKMDLPVYNNSDSRHAWFLLYQRIAKDDYELYLNSSPCSQAVFKDGMFVAGVGPNYK